VPAGAGSTGPGGPSPGCGCNGTGARARRSGRRTLPWCAGLAWSRYRVVIPFWDKTLPTIVACLDTTLRRIGGVPASALTDNEKTVTTFHIARIAVRNTEIVEVGRRYRVTIRTCVPADPETKVTEPVVPAAASVPGNASCREGPRSDNHRHAPVRLHVGGGRAREPRDQGRLHRQRPRTRRRPRRGGGFSDGSASAEAAHEETGAAGGRPRRPQSLGRPGRAQRCREVEAGSRAGDWPG
jgi:hypothetical protein